MTDGESNLKWHSGERWWKRDPVFTPTISFKSRLSASREAGVLRPYLMNDGVKS